MAKERAFSYRNVAGKGEPAVWEKWFQKTVADAVLMSDEDNEEKNIVDYVDEKIDEVNANGGYTHPTTPGNKHIPSGGSSGQILKWKADGEAQWGNEKSYSNASQSASGLMSATDKKKLDGVAEGANKTVVDDELSSGSTNPVQNKVVNAALAGKVPAARKVNGKALSVDITLAAADVGAIPLNQKGTAGGVAGLGSDGKVPSAQLPSYVDDVLEYDQQSAFPETGEDGKIYIAKDSNKTYRWSGTVYTEISASLALGETSSTAFRGDHGSAAYKHSQAAHAPANAEANVQSDWLEASSSSDAYIKNKPTSLPADGGNADTVGGHTVKKDVPANAEFTDTKPVNMKGATASTAGTAGYAPAPAAGANAKFLRGDGTWQNPPSYTHPSTHPASMITQDATHRFVSDEEIDTWNAAKQEAIDAIKALMSNTQVNNTGKIPTSALVYAMNQTLTKLNDAMKVTQGNATVNSQYITGGSCVYWRYGNVVSFRAAGTLSLTKLPKGSFTNVITGLPAAPVQNMAVTLDCLTEDQVYGVTTVFMNGAVAIQKSREITGQYFSYISGTYVCS